MRTPSSARRGSSEEMETEPADLLIDSNSLARSEEALRFLSNQSLVDSTGIGNGTTWEDIKDDQNVINGVADLFLQLQQQELSPSSPGSSLPDDDDVPLPAPLTKKTTALDIAALRKSLTGRPRLKRVCHICGRECPSRHKLQRHLSTHSEDRPYNCSICGKAFKWTEYLSKHMRTQHGAVGSSGPIAKPCIRHRSVNSPVESRNTMEAACSPKRTRKCCTHKRSLSNSSSNTTQQDTTNNRHSSTRTASISTTSDSTIPTTPTESVSSPNNHDNSESSNTCTSQPQNQMNNNNSSNSNPTMMQTDPFHFPFSANQYPTNGYYPGFYPLNPYHPYLNAAAAYNFPMPNHPYPPNAMMQNYPFDPMMHGYMMDSTSMGTDMMSPKVFDGNQSSTPKSASNASCQTQESQDPPQTNSNNKGLLKKKPSIQIINMTSKKDIGIQCEVGDETIRALYDEDGCYLEPSASPEGMSSSSFDDGDSCIICKYPCEEDGCNRAYVHRKDLIRHMRIVHGINPTILEPRIVETPAKPHICSIGDCNKSYYHMKDLRRHQRQCHLSALTGAQNIEGGLENGITSLRYPCDFNGCTKSYIHKKDLIRHKRMFHNDGANQPSIPDPVVVMQHLKKNKRSHDERASSEGIERDPKRSHLDSTSSNEAVLSFSSAPTTSNNTPPRTPLLSDVNSMSTTTLMDSISAAVANMVSIEDLSSQIFNMPSTAISSALSKSTELSSTADMLLENLSIPSPTASFASTGLLNDTNLISTTSKTC